MKKEKFWLLCCQHSDIFWVLDIIVKVHGGKKYVVQTEIDIIIY